jgi:hypothetical protein
MPDFQVHVYFKDTIFSGLDKEGTYALSRFPASALRNCGTFALPGFFRVVGLTLFAGESGRLDNE